VPVEFLSDAQAAAFGSFVGAPSRARLERFFFLDDEDRRLVDRRQRDHLRLGFGVQLGSQMRPVVEEFAARMFADLPSKDQQAKGELYLAGG
jgi:Domain of unknown function (DUF4158)